MGEFEAACNHGEILTKEEQKAHAQEKAEKAEHQKTEEQKKPTFNKYAELFIKEKAATLSATTIQSYKQALKRPAAVFGEMKLEDIDFLMVKQFITDLQTTKAENGKKPLAHGTIVTYYTTLHTLFESAVENGVIVQNPMQRMKKPKPRKDDFSMKVTSNSCLKTVFENLHLPKDIDWDEFLSTLQKKFNRLGHRWSRKKIEKLRPDFVLYQDTDKRILGVIEFDGEQHQNFVEFFFKTIEEFLFRSNADFVKNTLWEYLQIPMLRIRHDQVDKINEMVTDFVRHLDNYITRHNTFLTEEEYWVPLTKEKEQIITAFPNLSLC